MNVKYINPFIQSVSELFDSMFRSDVRRGNLSMSAIDATAADLVALIGITGAVQGNVAVAMPAGTATGMVGKLLGMEILEIDAVTTDGVAEVVNMIAGGAKSKLSSEANSAPLQLTLPTVLRGSDFAVSFPSQSLWLDIPFESDLGPFNLRVTLKDAENN